MKTPKNPRPRTKAPKRSRAAWAEEVSRWRASGVGADEHAAAHGLNVRTLTWWASRLQHASPRERSRPATTRFVPILASHATSAPDAQTPAVDSSGGGVIELVLADGLRVRVMGHVSSAALSRVLAATRGIGSC